MGMMLVQFIKGSRLLVRAAACVAATDAWAILERGVRRRVGASEDWPVLRRRPRAPSVTAFSRSASSRIMLADLPPSSWVTRFTVGAAAEATATPARVDPVKETIATSGCAAIAEPTVDPSPLTIFQTPHAPPALSRL